MQDTLADQPVLHLGATRSSLTNVYRSKTIIYIIQVVIFFVVHTVTEYFTCHTAIVTETSKPKPTGHITISCLHECTIAVDNTATRTEQFQ